MSTWDGRLLEKCFCSKQIFISIHHLNDAEKIWAIFEFEYIQNAWELSRCCVSIWLFLFLFFARPIVLVANVQQKKEHGTQWRMNPNKVYVDAVHSLSYKCIPRIRHWISICFVLRLCYIHLTGKTEFYIPEYYSSRSWLMCILCEMISGPKAKLITLFFGANFQPK